MSYWRSRAAIALIAGVMVGFTVVFLLSVLIGGA